MGNYGSEHTGSIEALGGEKRKTGMKIRSNSEDRPTLPLNVFACGTVSAVRPLRLLQTT
jgi:hypothetical protein